MIWWAVKYVKEKSRSEVSTLLLFLLGTNDIDGVVYCKFHIVGYEKRCHMPIIPKQLVDMDTVKRDSLNLMDTVRSFNSIATIVICGLLHRLDDWAWSKEFSFDMNNFLLVWYCQQVAKGRRPSSTYYRWDGVHQSDEGYITQNNFCNKHCQI